MTVTIPSTALVAIQPAFTDAERLALAGYLAGYRGLTREAYTVDLRQFTGWCRARSLPLFSVRRADIETYARELEAKGRARATVTRRLCTIAGLYKYAVEEELLDHSPAAHDAGVPLRDVQEAASHADPRTTMRYDRARTSLDRHATYIVVAFVAGAAR
jgi:integrase